MMGPILKSPPHLRLINIFVFKARVGGIVSPKGYSFIGNSAQELNLGEIGVMAAVKRIDLDEKIVRAAQRAGAHLTENSQVTVSILLVNTFNDAFSPHTGGS
jgi:hypothetical protein